MSLHETGGRETYETLSSLLLIGAGETRVISRHLFSNGREDVRTLGEVLVLEEEADGDGLVDVVDDRRTRVHRQREVRRDLLAVAGVLVVRRT